MRPLSDFKFAASFRYLNSRLTRPGEYHYRVNTITGERVVTMKIRNWICRHEITGTDVKVISGRDSLQFGPSAVNCKRITKSDQTVEIFPFFLGSNSVKLWDLSLLLLPVLLNHVRVLRLLL